MEPNEKPRLVMTGSKDEPMNYQCSQCGQLFILPDDQTPKEAAAELLAAFQDHVGEEHAEQGKD